MHLWLIYYQIPTPLIQWVRAGIHSGEGVADGRDSGQNGGMADAKSEPTAPSAPSDDAKAKFKAALDAKNAKSRQAGSGGEGESTSAIKGGGTTGPTQRMFRRKAGG